MKLSILICHIPERKDLLDRLISKLEPQLNKDVEVLIDSTPKGVISIGKKMQTLLEKSKGEYIVYIDDDDIVMDDYVESILSAIKHTPDCVGLKVYITTDGKDPKIEQRSLSNKNWIWNSRKKGIDYEKNVTHYNPVKRELALQVGFEDVGYGGDKIYSYEVSKICNKEIYIDEILVHYDFISWTNKKDRYGIC